MKTIEKNSLKTLLKLEKNTYDWYNFCANIEEIERRYWERSQNPFISYIK